MIGLNDAARYLGISRRGVYNLIAPRKLDARKLNKRTLLDFDEVANLAANLPRAKIARRPEAA